MAGPTLVHRLDAPWTSSAEEALALLGGKGAALTELTAMGLPVPPGFVLTTDLYRSWEADGALPEGFDDTLRAEVAHLEGKTGLGFGDGEAPLLLAVRSGAPVSMPGMLETVLHVGTNEATAAGLAARFGDPGLGRDVRRRFVEAYGTVVLGIPRAAFDTILRARGIGVTSPRPEQIDSLLADFASLLSEEAGEPAPTDPWAQLTRAVDGVLASWRSPRAAQFREAHGIDHHLGTAVVVQAMVFGQAGPRSASGVVFSRNPSHGENALFGEYLPGAPGEDVVGGRRTPQPLTRAQVRRGRADRSLEAREPAAIEELARLCQLLEARYRDAQDVEFVLERGRLFVVQRRAAHRTARAAARIASDMVDEGLIDEAEALRRIAPSSLRQLLTPRLADPEVLAERGITPLARGLAASPGAACGRVALDDHALEAGEDGILVRPNTSAEDVEAMRRAVGVVTAAGGLTSHAAVVARAMGKPCVVGATALRIDPGARTILIYRHDGDTRLAEGDLITIDGARGLVYAGDLPVEPAAASSYVERILGWADEARQTEVWAEAKRPRSARSGVAFGADAVRVPAPALDRIEAFRPPGAEGRLVWGAVDAEEAKAAVGQLRAGDRLVVALKDVDAVLPAATAAGVEVGVRAPRPAPLPPGAAFGVLAEAPDALPSGAWVVPAGDRALPPRLAEGATLLAITSPPVEVAMERLRAAHWALA
ncbi:MAG: PEP/pyruvate-binding domain-containing protein [Sandaracinaceae bacterium]